MAINEPDETPLCRSVRPLVQAHPDKSGIAALVHGRDAFTARMLLANDAERTMCSTTFGTTTCQERCFSKRCGERPIGAFE
jgi:hypothetical protein